MVNRMDKINEIIKQEISICLQKMIPEAIVSVTQAKVSKDLGYAKVWISAPKKVEDSVQKECQKLSSEIRAEIASKINLRKTPKIHFVLDQTKDEADKIDELLKNLDK